jgi:hypothetical protein
VTRGVSSSTTAFAGRKGITLGATAVAMPPVMAWRLCRRETSPENADTPLQISKTAATAAAKPIVVLVIMMEGEFFDK